MDIYVPRPARHVQEDVVTDVQVVPMDALVAHPVEVAVAAAVVEDVEDVVPVPEHAPRATDAVPVVDVTELAQQDVTQPATQVPILQHK